MLWLWILLGVLGGLILLFFGALYFVYWNTFYSPHKGQNNDFVLTDATNKYCDKEVISNYFNK